MKLTHKTEQNSILYIVKRVPSFVVQMLAPDMLGRNFHALTDQFSSFELMFQNKEANLGFKRVLFVESQIKCT